MNLIFKIFLSDAILIMTTSSIGYYLAKEYEGIPDIVYGILLYLLIVELLFLPALAIFAIWTY